MTGGSYQYGKKDIIKFLNTTLPNKAKILDVGAGGGTYGYYLQDKSYIIDAIEIWPESITALKESKWYNNIYEEDIRKFKYKDYYDLIIFGDVLEHLSIEDVQKVLKEAKNHTKAIMIAVPYLYEQDALYGNEAEKHLQADLTLEIFEKRYPGYKLLIKNKDYGYYYKNLIEKETNMDKKICMYAICKNELKFVEQWLNNVSEADYIVVLDTGSTDGTYEALKADPRVTLVKQKTISPWRFDVARNESMKLVPKDAEILICTDFDELLSPGWAQVIKDNWHENTNRMYYDYAWSHNAIGEPTDIFTYDKIHSKDFKWKFPVHEVLWPKNDNMQTNAVDVGRQIFLQHYPDNTKERKYYFDLLKLAVKEHPEDSHERMLLAREYLLQGDYENAKNEYMATLNMPDVDAPEKRLVLLESLGRCADIFKILKEYDTSIWYCQEFIKEDHTYREPYLIMASIYNEMKMPTLAEACVEQALKYGTRKNTWVERADTWIDEPDDILSLSYYQLGDYDKAIQHVSEVLKHKPNDTRVLKNYAVFLQCKLEEINKKLNS